MVKKHIFRTLLVFSIATILVSCDSSDTPKNEHEHSYSIDWKYNDSNHWRNSSCGHDVKSEEGEHTLDTGTIKIAASESSNGILEKKCTVCGYTVTEEIPQLIHNHSFSTEWSGDKTQHWHQATCSHDLKNDLENHSYGAFQVTVEPTESVVGQKERVCSICGYADKVEVRYSNPDDDPYPVENYYNGYYSSIVSWVNGEDLKQQLFELIRKDFTGLTYSGNWETNQVAEQCAYDFTKVNVVYSQKDDSKSNTYGQTSINGWQREHAFCASLMTAYNTSEAVNIRSSGTSRATDFHNLFAAYGAANGSRGNKNLGTYDPSKVQTDSKAVYADTNFDVNNYEPNDCDKGRMARAVLYMGVMYDAEETSNISLSFRYGSSQTKSVTVPAKYKPLKIKEDYVSYSQTTFTDFVSSANENCQKLRDTYYEPYKTANGGSTAAYISYGESGKPDDNILSSFGKAYADYRYAEGSFAIGNLSTLLSWASRPVDRQEMWHNQVVYSYIHKEPGDNYGKKQGNRNPFVDYPELAEYIYGSKKNDFGELGELHPSEDLLQSNSGELENYAITSYKDKYLVGETFSKADYTLVRVNKNFITQELDYEDNTEDYTFVKEDIGEKQISLVTPTGTINYVVNVESNTGINACNYNLITNKNAFTTNKIQIAPAKILSYGGVEFNVSAGVDNCSIGSSGNAVKIGGATTTTPPAQTVTLETVSEFNYQDKVNINSVYLGLNAASGCTYSYRISVGGEQVATGVFSYNQAGPLIYGADFDAPKTGILKIELIGCDKAVYISQISLNVN